MSVFHIHPFMPNFQNTVYLAYWFMLIQLLTSLSLSVPLYARHGGLEKHHWSFRNKVVDFMKSAKSAEPQTLDITGMPGPYRNHFKRWCKQLDIGCKVSGDELVLVVDEPCTPEMIDEAENPPERWKWGPSCVSYDVGFGNFCDDGVPRQFDYMP